MRVSPQQGHVVPSAPGPRRLPGLSRAGLRSISKATRLGPLELAILSLGAGAIHFGVVSEHFAEDYRFGMFFVLVGWFEVLWALAYVAGQGRRIAAIALLANGATIAVWAWAHLIGLPFGPHPGQVEPSTATDLMATLFELLIVGGLATSVGTRHAVGANAARTRPGASGAGRLAWQIAIVALVGIGTTVALNQRPM